MRSLRKSYWLMMNRNRLQSSDLYLQKTVSVAVSPPERGIRSTVDGDDVLFVLLIPRQMCNSNLLWLTFAEYLLFN